MSIFAFKKKETDSCCCGTCSEYIIEDAVNSQSIVAPIKILGSGCAKCNQLEANTIEALKKINMDTTIDQVKDFSHIASYRVMTTPAIVYNGKVISYGKVLKPDEIVALLQKEGI